MIEVLDPGYVYTDPTGSDNSNLCKCNTVVYSFISACDGCWGAEWIMYGGRFLLDSLGLYVCHSLVDMCAQSHEDYAFRLFPRPYPHLHRRGQICGHDIIWPEINLRT